MTLVMQILRKLALTCKVLGIWLSDPKGTKTQMNFLDDSLNLVLGNGRINPSLFYGQPIVIHSYKGKFVR